MTRIFVTGGSGFIGTNLVQSLLDVGCEVLNFDHKAPLNRNHAACHEAGEILDSEGLESALQSFQPELVYTSRAAATSTVPRSQTIPPTPQACATSSRQFVAPEA